MAIAVRAARPGDGTRDVGRQAGRHALGPAVDAIEENGLVAEPRHHLGQELLQGGSLRRFWVELLKDQAESLDDRPEEVTVALQDVGQCLLARCSSASLVSIRATALLMSVAMWSSDAFASIETFSARGGCRASCTGRSRAARLSTASRLRSRR